MKIFYLILFFLLHSSLLFSDTLILKNGGTIKGKVTEEGNEYIVELPYGTTKFDKSSVSEVKYSEEDTKEVFDDYDREKVRNKLTKAAKKVASEKRQQTTAKTRKPISNAHKYLEIGRKGEKIDLEEYVVEGKITIFDFYSDYCGPCRAVAPRLKKLSKTNNDIYVRKIDINRSNIKGIDWKSPVVQQYRIRSVPYFIIYNEKGNRWLTGRNASNKIYNDWLE